MPKMKFLGQGFLKLEPEKNTQTDAHT